MQVSFNMEGSKGGKNTKGLEGKKPVEFSIWGVAHCTEVWELLTILFVNDFPGGWVHCVLSVTPSPPSTA